MNSHLAAVWLRVDCALLKRVFFFFRGQVEEAGLFLSDLPLQEDLLPCLLFSWLFLWSALGAVNIFHHFVSNNKYYMFENYRRWFKYWEFIQIATFDPGRLPHSILTSKTSLFDDFYPVPHFLSQLAHSAKKLLAGSSQVCDSKIQGSEFTAKIMPKMQFSFIFTCLLCPFWFLDWNSRLTPALILKGKKWRGHLCL